MMICRCCRYTFPATIVIPAWKDAIYITITDSIISTIIISISTAAADSILLYLLLHRNINTRPSNRSVYNPMPLIATVPTPSNLPAAAKTN